jgi:hypothetical protein
VLANSEPKLSKITALPSGLRQNTTLDVSMLDTQGSAYCAWSPWRQPEEKNIRLLPDPRGNGIIKIGNSAAPSTENLKIFRQISSLP